MLNVSAIDPSNASDLDDAKRMLEVFWKDEWHQLSTVQQNAILSDFANMVADEGWDSLHDASFEYQGRIFIGNLMPYAKTLEVK